MNSTKNYYEILEVSPNASTEVIEKAYRTLMQKYHPDHAPEELRVKYNGRARDLNEAKSVLLNAVKRRSYDARRTSDTSATATPRTAKPKAARPASTVAPNVDGPFAGVVEKNPAKNIVAGFNGRKDLAQNPIGSFAVIFVLCWGGLLAFAVLGFIVTAIIGLF